MSGRCGASFAAALALTTAGAIGLAVANDGGPAPELPPPLNADGSPWVPADASPEVAGLEPMTGAGGGVAYRHGNLNLYPFYFR